MMPNKRCYEVKIMGKRPAVAGSWTQDTSGLICQCSASEPRQPDNHQLSLCMMTVNSELISFLFPCYVRLCNHVCVCVYIYIYIYILCARSYCSVCTVILSVVHETRAHLVTTPQYSCSSPVGPNWTCRLWWDTTSTTVEPLLKDTPELRTPWLIRTYH